MKTNNSIFDDAGAAPSFDNGESTAVAVPGTPDNGLIVDDDGDSYPLALDAAAGSVSLSAGSAKPVATIATLADYLVNGFWQYNSSIGHHWASSTVTYNIGGLNSAEQFLAQSALQAWHDVANINFVQTSGAANIMFSDAGTMQAVTNASWYGSGAMASASVDISSDWISTDGGARDGKTGIDSYGYQTYIHEIGHALGLGHQGPYNGSASYSTNALYANDTWQYSVMSYFAENNYSGSSYRYVISPQMADIYAVGLMYGAATTTRTGDTVYGFHSNAGSIFDFNAYTQAPALTIYDSGGNDTLDCSLYSAAQTIDLHAGSFSSVGGLVNNIGIALNANIENAIGGSGGDTLIANNNGCVLSGAAGADGLVGGAGNDRLIGGSGTDTLTGNGGADTFVFALGDSSAASGQHDRIADFSTGVDRIDLSGIDAIASTGGYELFHFIGSNGFGGVAGELDYFYNSALGVTTLRGDTNGDAVADFAVDLTGNVSINAGDLVGAYTVAVVIESLGATTLTQLGSTYYLYAHGTSSGPALKAGGAFVAAGSNGTWNPIAAEQTATGYEVAWKDSVSGQYIVWATDFSGNLASFLTGVVSGTNAALKSLEASFQQDLNGDGVITAPTTIESFGSTKLDQAGANYYLDSVSGGLGPLLKAGGTAVAAGANGTWNPIGVEQTATGYEVAWKDSGSSQYIVWATDFTGNLTSFLTGVVSGTDATLKSLEASFQQDLNGDGTITAPTTIEAFGSTKLDQSGTSYYLDGVGGGSGPAIKVGGVAVAAGSQGNWTPIGAEQTAGGYEVAWKNGGLDQYVVWATDSSGNLTALMTGVVAGASTTLKSFEASFQQDLNGDGTITASTTIEAFGSTKLDQSGASYYLDGVGGGSGPSIKVGGAAVAVGSQGTWNPIGAEQTASGYEVAWKNGSADQYVVWATDSSGNLTSLMTGVVAGASATLKNLETSFHQDLNADGVISPVGAAALGNAAAADLLQFVGSNSPSGFNFASTGSGAAGPVIETAKTDDLPGFVGAHPGTDAVADIYTPFAPSSGGADAHAAMPDAQHASVADLHLYTQGFHLL